MLEHVYSHEGSAVRYIATRSPEAGKSLKNKQASKQASKHTNKQKHLRTYAPL
jgi:hypothetical protein